MSTVTRRGRSWTALAVLASCLAAGCSQKAPSSPLPRGAFLAGDAETLHALLLGAAALRGTPLARRAAGLRGQLATCERIYGHVGDGDVARLLDDLRCGTPSEVAAVMTALGGALGGDSGLAFGLPLTPDPAAPRVVGTLHLLPGGGLRAEARLSPLPEGGAARLLLPAQESAGPSALGTRDLLLHARLRPGAGLNVADLVSAGGQADRMFGLKSRLFAGAVLEGTIEVAVYLPAPAAAMPPTAIGVDFAMRAPVVAAVGELVTELEATWPIRRSVRSFGTHRGACFADLRILPDFAPCWVATHRTLIVGWNAESVRRALEPATAESGADDGLVAYLGRFAEADRRLRDAASPGAPAPALDYLWDRLAIEGRRDGDAVSITATLSSVLPVAEPIASVMEPSANVMEPSAKLMEPSASVMEPSAKLMEPSANVVEPSANQTQEPSAGEIAAAQSIPGGRF